MIIDRIASLETTETSDTDDGSSDTVVAVLPPIGNLLGVGRERTAPVPLGGGAEDVSGGALVPEQNGPFLPHTEGK